jgi:hypothetical protein
MTPVQAQCAPTPLASGRSGAWVGGYRLLCSTMGLDDFEVIQPLGRGHFAKVDKVRSTGVSRGLQCQGQGGR